MTEEFKPRKRQVIKFPGKGRVKQQFREESDVNVIMARWRKTGILPSGTAKQPMYGDFSNAVDYQSARQAVNDAEDSFMKLPAKIRARFDHDPFKLLEFMNDQANEAEAIELGVIPNPEEPGVVEPEASAAPGEGEPEEPT